MIIKVFSFLKPRYFYCSLIIHVVSQRFMESKHDSTDSRDYIMIYLYLIRKLEKMITLTCLRTLALTILSAGTFFPLPLCKPWLKCDH